MVHGVAFLLRNFLLGGPHEEFKIFVSFLLRNEWIELVYHCFVGFSMVRRIAYVFEWINGIYSSQREGDRDSLSIYN
jgi:hypothetical protein